MNTQRTIKILTLGILTALSAGIASAQTGSLQGRQLFLYDGGTAANLNRITLQTPADATLVANWALTFPATAGTVNQLMVNTGAGVLDWTSSLTLQDLTINGTITLPGLTPGLPLQVDGTGEVVSELINLTGAADVTGTLPVTNGGTGLSSVTTGDILIATAANTLTPLPIGIPGEYLGVTAGLPDWKPIASDMWVLGGNTSGITGVNNILGINMASAAPLRMYSNGFERMRLTSGGDVRIENLDGVGATQLNIVGTATQAGANLLNIQNSAANFAFRVDEQPGTLARIQIGDGTLDGRIRLFNGAGNGVANIELQNNLGAARNYTIPTVEGNGRFVVANGAGTAGQILQTNGNNLRATWTSTPTLTDLTLTGNLQVDGNTTLGSDGTDVVTINGATSFPNLAPGLPLQTNGAGLVVSELINLTGATDVTGTLPVGNGGTGLTTIPLNGIMYGNGTGAVQTTVGAPGQMLTAGVAGLPTWTSTFPTGINVPFNQISTGNNATATMTVDNGASILLGTAGAVIQSNQFITAASLTSAVDLSTTEVNGILPIANGGTGANNAVTALSNLGGQPLDADLTAISALATTGHLVRTGAGTYATRTIVGVAPIAVSNGDGVAGDPTISLTGIVPVANGGTGLSTAPVNSILYASAANTYSSLTPGNNQILISGPAGVPVWSSSLPTATTVPFNQISTGANSTAAMTVNNGASIVLGTAGAIIEANRFIGSGSTTNAVDLATAEVNGILPIANGGTGSSTAGGALTNLGAQPVDAELTAISGLAGTGFAVQTGAGTYAQRTIVGVSPISVANGNGVAGDPTISLTGIVPVANGGTGLATITTNAIIYGNGAGNVLSTVGAAGQILTAGVGGVPTWSSTFPSGINIPFGQIATGNNSLATMTVDNGASILLGTAGAVIQSNQFITSASVSSAVDLATTEVNGILPIANGGTGSSTAGGALTNLGAQPVDAELTAISGLAGTGFAVQTGAGTYAQRTIVGVSPISVANGNGVAGDPTISLTGIVPVANGGTGLSTAPINSILYASAANTYSSLAAGSNGQVLTITLGVPTWVTPAGSSFSTITTGANNSATMTVDNGASIVLGTAGAIIEANRFIGSGSTTNAVDLATAEVNGILPIANGGTGSSTAGGALTNLGAQPVDAELTAISGLAGTGFAVQTGAGTYAQRTIVGVSPISVANGNGVAGNPTISLTGIVPVANGGTGQDFSAVPIGSIMYANAVGGFTTLPAASNGDVLTLTAGVPSWVPTAGSSFSAITTGTNATATMTVNNGASILLGSAGAIIEANRFIGSGSTTNAVDLATAEVNGILPIANGGTGSSTAGGALTNLGAQPVDADLTSIAGVATTGILVRTGVDTYNTRLIAGTANEITVTNGDGVGGNPTISIPTAVTFTGKTVTGGTFTGSTLSGVTTKTGTTVNTANTAAAVAPTALGAPLAAFVNTWEKVEISNNGTGGTAYVSLPAGTDGQVMYVRFRYSWTAGANAVIVRQPDNVTATAIAFGGGAVGTIVTHMVYSGDESRWVILSAINNP